MFLWCSLDILTSMMTRLKNPMMVSGSLYQLNGFGCENKEQGLSPTIWLVSCALLIISI